MKLFSVRGGGWFGMFSATWPFVKLSVYEDKLEIQRPSLSGVSNDSYMWDEIASVKRLRMVPVIADGVYISPKNKDWFVFWSLSGASSQKIVDISQSKGVRISESEPKAITGLRILIWLVPTAFFLSILAMFISGF